MKTIAKRLIAAIAAMTLLIPSASVWAAKGETDIDIAVGKPAISACYGTGDYFGNVANVTTPDTNDVFTSDGGTESTGMEMVTIDLGARYSINQIDVWNYYGYEAVGSDIGYYPEDVVFEMYVTNTKPANQKDAPADAVKLNVIGDLFNRKSAGGFDSHFQLAEAGSYRYVQLRLWKGTNQNTAFRIGNINVWTDKVSPIVSVGKPVYTAFWTNYMDNIVNVNDGTASTKHGIFLPKGKAIDAYGSPDVIMDLEGKYPIEMVVVDVTDSNLIDEVLVSNSPDFADDSTVSLYYDGSAYVLDESDAADFGNAFRYVKAVVALEYNESADYMQYINEITVYSSKAEAVATTKPENRVNLALNATVTASNMGAAYTVAEGWKYMNDGLYDQSVLAYAGNIWIQYDLGGYYTIDSVRTIMHKTGIGGMARTCAVEKILLSNNSSFPEDTSFVIPGDACRYNSEHSDVDNAYIKNSYSPAVAPSERRAYRYVRVCMDGTVNTSGWQLNEIEVYGNYEETTMTNVIEDADLSILTGTGSSWYSDKQNMVDGDLNTGAACYGTVVFPLPYPMEIDRIEIATRPGYDSDIYVTAGHNIWLANTDQTLSGSVKINSAYEGDADNLVRTYHAGEVVAYNVHDDNKYAYVFINARLGGEFFVQEVKIYSNDTVEGTAITTDLTGEQAKGEVLTLSTEFRSEEAINKTVNFYIARYDNGALTDVKMSADKTFSGMSGSDSYEYTITDDVTAQTEFKGFVWEKGTMDPFAQTAEIAPYAEFWVDPNAETNGDGSEASPFKTISAAKNAVNAVNDDMQGDIVVNLKSGKYRIPDEQNYIYFGSGDGGTNGYNVIYRNAPGETPVITTGKAITGFTDADSDGIYEADASDFDSIYELTVNGVAANLASTEEPITATNLYDGSYTGGYTGGIGFAKTDLPAISNPEDAFVHVASSWVDVMYKVTDVSVDGNNYKYVVDSARLGSTTKNEALSSNHTVIDASDKFYVENALELLDNPGEFYFDKGDGILYYMPREGEDMTSATVEAALTDSLVNISGSKGNTIKNLVLSGIKFENATFDMMYDYGFTTAQSQVVTFDIGRFVEGSIWVNHAENIEISDCEFTGITKPAISFVQGVVDSKITRNNFNNLGGSAIVVGTNNHEAIEYENEARCERNTISDNVIDNPALKMKGSPAIACYYVVDTDIVHNKITECNYTGISLGWGWNNFPDLTACANNTVTNNYIENVNLVAADGGAIYTLGNLPNAVIEGNYYVQNKMPQQNSGTIGIYTDEGTQNVTITGNVIDMKAVENIDGDVYAISAWKNTIKNVNATGNYATFTAVRNYGTNCTIDTPTAYTAGSEPAAVQAIIAASAANLK